MYFQKGFSFHGVQKTSFSLNQSPFLMSFTNRILYRTVFQSPKFFFIKDLSQITTTTNFYQGIQMNSFHTTKLLNSNVSKTENSPEPSSEKSTTLDYYGFPLASEEISGPFWFGFGGLVILVVVLAMIFSNFEMRSTKPYQLALSHLKNEPIILKEIGTQIKEPWRIKSQRSKGKVCMSFRISGEKGSGKVSFCTFQAPREQLVLSHLHIVLDSDSNTITFIK